MKTKTSHITRLTLLLIAAVTFIGCESTTQTTSGKDYISKYEPAPVTGSVSNIDQEVREIANVEPILNFPARIGLAKIYNGQISNLSEQEVTEWSNAAQTLGEDFGEFIPVSALIAEMVYTPSNGMNGNHAAEVVRKIRLGAARQHLDAVLIYEVFSETEERTLPTAVAAWTIIGAYIVPSEESKTVGYANALLVDVRNGYPYGTATARATESDINTMVDSYDGKNRQRNKAEVAAAVNLVYEAIDMFVKLKTEL